MSATKTKSFIANTWLMVGKTSFLTDESIDFVDVVDETSFLVSTL
jgi:hypothetical protein